MRIRARKNNVHIVCIIREALAHRLQDRSILLRTDNVTVVACVNKLMGRSQQLNDLVREIFDLLTQHNISLRAVYLPGKDNHGLLL